MATQVVNLLHYRSLDLGAVPPNLEFGQFGINVYNANNPVLPTLREVYLFVGTGGNERVNEDGTDLTTEAFNAGAFAGEALVNGKGWVRFNLRSLSTGGDTMYGDLIMSGARIRFESGLSGNAELILPDETVAVNGTLAGSIRYNSISNEIEIWDGTVWSSVSPRDFQVAATDPTVRSNGRALDEGDLYYNSTFSKLYVYQTGAWAETQNNTNVQVTTTAPTTRSNTEALRTGDLYFDPSANTLFVWDGAVWQKVVGPSGDFQITTGVVPTTRSDGTDALQLGDWWYDNSTVLPLLHFWDGTQWIITTDGGVY